MPDDKNVWSTRPNGTVMNRVRKKLYSLELTRTTHERADEEERRWYTGSDWKNIWRNFKAFNTNGRKLVTIGVV
jgi:hypothetical protein